MRNFLGSLIVASAFAVTAAPSVVGAQPSVAVMIASSSDSSPGTLDAHARGQHGQIVRQALHDVLRRTGAEVRLMASGVRRLDVAVTGWKIATLARQIDVAVEMRVIVVDQHGRMLSILTGRAKITAAEATPLAELRAQAIAEAIRGMTPALQAQLRRDVG
ncbi:MAG TPA: hypothetical protein VGC42_30650 [Kofleriaceae bacterium]